MTLKEFKPAVGRSDSGLLRKGATIQLYTFAMAHNLFQGSELEKAIHALTLKSKSGKITVIDEGILGPIPHDPRYELQIEDLRFTIDKYGSNGRARVVFGDYEDLCAIQALAPDNLTVITLRSREMIKIALTELAKDESIPTLIIAGLVHIAQINAILRKVECEPLATNDIQDVMRRSEPHQPRHDACVKGLALMVTIAERSQLG